MGMEIGIEENKETQDNNILGSSVIIKDKNKLPTVDKIIRHSEEDVFKDRNVIPEINETNLSTNKVNNSQNLIQEPQMTESQILPNSNIQQDANLRFSNDIQNPEFDQGIQKSTAIEAQNEIHNSIKMQQMSNSQSQISNFNNSQRQDLQPKESQFIESQAIYDDQNKMSKKRY